MGDSVLVWKWVWFLCVHFWIDDMPHSSSKSPWRHTDNARKVYRTQRTRDLQDAWLHTAWCMFSFYMYGYICVYALCLWVITTEGGSSKQGMKHWGKRDQRRVEPVHTRLLLLMHIHRVCYYIQLCVCHMLLCYNLSVCCFPVVDQSEQTQNPCWFSLFSFYS